MRTNRRNRPALAMMRSLSQGSRVIKAAEDSVVMENIVVPLVLGVDPVIYK